mmetsp:Transcript_15272/g.50170  ORF Transcript_15272/g.50170 Transcript_15272/m.50170 type:complete len:214 (+) Transcript_15272:327-968(+)
MGDCFVGADSASASAMSSTRLPSMSSPASSICPSCRYFTLTACRMLRNSSLHTRSATEKSSSTWLASSVTSLSASISISPSTFGAFERLRNRSRLFSSLSSCVLISLLMSPITSVCTVTFWQSLRNLGMSAPWRSFEAFASLKTIHCCVKLAPMTEMGSARMMMDAIIVMLATTCPTAVAGTTSPYPTVISVTMHHQKLFGMLANGSSPVEST